MGKKWDLIVKCVRIKQEPHDSEFDLAEKQSRKHDLYMFFKKGCKSYTRVSCPQYRFCIFVCLFFVLSSTHQVQRDFLERSKNSNGTENDATVHERMILNTRLAKISFTFLLCFFVLLLFLLFCSDKSISATIL